MWTIANLKTLNELNPGDTARPIFVELLEEIDDSKSLDGDVFH